MDSLSCSAALVARFSDVSQCEFFINGICISKFEWVSHLQKLSALCNWWILHRYTIWTTLKESGYDPSGIFREWLFHELGHRQTEAWIRASGFVHIAQFSGLYWGLFRSYFEWILEKIHQIGIGRFATYQSIGWVISVLAGTYWIALSGFRWGPIRAIFIGQIIFSIRRTGLRSGTLSFWFLLIGVEVIRLVFTPHLEGRYFWLMGATHLYLASLGSIWGYRQVRTHLGASIASWVFTLPVSFIEIPYFSIATPILNLMTSYVVAPIWLLGILLVSGFSFFGASVGAEFILKWISVFTHVSIVKTAEVLSEANYVFQIRYEIFVGYSVAMYLLYIFIEAHLDRKGRCFLGPHH